MNGARRDLELAPEQVRRIADPAALGFDTTAMLPPVGPVLGQARAMEAIEFALAMADRRYNLYVTGEPGSGRLTAVMAAVRAAADRRGAPSDWCYVENFEQPEQPRALALPAGAGRPFARDVAAYVAACRRELRRAFTDETYFQHRASVVRPFERRIGDLWTTLRGEALALGFGLRGTASSLVPVPLRPAPATPPPNDAAEPQPLTEEEFEALPPPQQEAIRQRHTLAEETIHRMLPRVRALEDEARARVRRLDREIAGRAVKHLADELRQRHGASKPVATYLHQLAADIVAHANVLSAPDDDQPADAAPAPRDDEPEQDDQPAENSPEALELAASGEGDGDHQSSVPLGDDVRLRPALADLLRRYRVHPLVTHAAGAPAPVVQEPNPTYQRLLGHIEYGQRAGMPYTDHLMIRPGALHRANGGFLVLHARDMLGQSSAWDAVKRVLRFGVITAGAAGEMPGLPVGAALLPEPIPASVKVVLVGDVSTYTELVERDPDFHQLFKVRADFESEMPRTRETESFYARFAGEAARTAGAVPLTAAAVAQIIEEGSRWADDQERLSTSLGSLSDLTLEAGHWAARAGAAATDRAHVRQAIATRERRVSLVADHVYEMIDDRELLIDTSGAAIGQVNGLTVMTAAEHTFGRPVRITARTAPGWSGVVDIEREIAMSGPDHSRGVLILSGYLLGRFAQEFPLALAASLCFEQMYDGVDGDSASSAELYALLSSLSGVEVRQSLAVTGSVNQRGEIQAVGGVTHKVEGFFRACRARGLTGEQGVLIPRANVRHLMLREDVVEAVRRGAFHIYAVSTIDEGIELLTGIPAGRPDASGRYLEGTISARVGQALRAYSERVRAAGVPVPPAGRPGWSH
jgi:predicted ATP-dependent protease